MKLRKKETDQERVAREYIDRIIAINRRHGMGETPKETYNRAVKSAARALSLRRPAGPEGE